MTHKLISFIFLFFIFSLFGGCRESNNSSKALNHIENLIEKDHDSISIILRDLANNNMSEMQQARYNLLLLYTKYKQSTSLLPYDSLINKTLEIFSNKHDSKKEYALGLLFKSRYKKENNSLENAVSDCHKALNILNKSPNKSIERLIYKELGELYKEEGLYDESMTMYKEVYNIDCSLETEKNICLSLRNIGIIFFYKDMLDSASIYFHKALSMLNENDYSSKNRSLIYSDLSLLYKNRGENKKALNNISLAITFDQDSLALQADYLAKGELLMDMEQNDSARYYFQLSSKSKNLYTKTSSYYNLYLLEKKLGNYSEAFIYNDSFLENYDSIQTKTNSLAIERLHYKYEIEKKITEEKTQYKIQMTILIVAILVIILIGIIYYLRRTNKLKENILGYQQDIMRTRVEIEKLQEGLSDLGLVTKREQNLLQQLYSLIEEEVTASEKLFKLSDIYRSLKRSEDKKNNRFFNEYNKKMVEDKINEIFDGFMKHLSLLCPQLTKRDIFLCCMLKTGLDNLTIAMCFGYFDTTAINQRKYRIRLKINEVPSNVFLEKILFKTN